MLAELITIIKLGGMRTEQSFYGVNLLSMACLIRKHFFILDACFDSQVKRSKL